MPLRYARIWFDIIDLADLVLLRIFRAHLTWARRSKQAAAFDLRGSPLQERFFLTVHCACAHGVLFPGHFFIQRLKAEAGRQAMKNIRIRKTVLPQLDIERGIALPLIIAERTQIPLLLQSRKAAIDTWGLTVRHIIPAEGNDIVCSRSHRRSGILPVPGMRGKYGTQQSYREPSNRVFLSYDSPNHSGAAAPYFVD